MPTSRRINIIFRDNGQGLSRDALIVRDALRRAGHQTWLTPQAPRRFPLEFRYAPELSREVIRRARQGAIQALAFRRRFWDLNIFLENLEPRFFDRARVNCFVPNQEWLSDADRGLLSSLDLVLFKTRHAEQLLAKLTKHSAFIGFTSIDRREPTITRRWDAALHVSGWNPQKGTASLVDAWSTHISWPTLTIVSQLALPPQQRANIVVRRTRLPDAALRRLQNECAVHVCPSEVEGFGHTLMEGMSCGAVVVTTDAPPMNAMVSSAEGFLVPYTATEKMNAGMRYIVDSKGLAAVLDSVWKGNPVELKARARAARLKYDSERATFYARLARVTAEI